MKLTYYGHSAFLVETAGHKLLFDPFLSGNPHAAGVVSAADLHPDVILLTHAHGDHWGDTLEIARQSGALIVANFEITSYAQRNGHDRVQPMNTGGSWNFPWGRLTQTYARHSSSFPDGTYGGNPNGYLLCAEGRWIYNTGDTSPFTEMAWIGEDFAVDLALMPIGDCFTMGPEGAVRATKLIRPKLTVPLHYGTFPMIEVDTNRWAEQMAAAGFAARVLNPGEHLHL
ncbi:MAG: metal-dependent hydrolase [Bacteroidota bacterium]|nr:metal-dependent hydrolase [Bacteroidota bacterium]MDE2956482.1 metal-dependent hydrolase [Bacteroidota bacterium]